MMYKIDKEAGPHREAVENWLFGLDHVSKSCRELIVTAWVSAWTSSEYESITDFPWDRFEIDYPLATHVNEVTKAGLAFAEFASAQWNIRFDPETLIPILCLHDVDKPLIFVRRNGRIEHSDLYHQLPHGVAGALLLKELGFSDTVVSTVATHSPRMPMKGLTFDAWVLSYADLFCCDKVLLDNGIPPFYSAQPLPNMFTAPLPAPAKSERAA